MTAGPGVVGAVGLGNMGGALAANLVAAGLTVVAHDAAGPDRAPEGATFLPDVAEVARRADVVVLSLPEGAALASVVAEILATVDRRTSQVVDTSTIGVATAEALEAELGAAGIGYVDAPVSGGVAGARARTLAVMYAGTDESCAAVAAVLAGLSDRRTRVGDRAGLAQAVKLANNFLSATALAAASEAVAFATAVGVDMATVLEVVNGSSGQSAATLDKFPNHVLTGRYASGFSNSLMAKDLALYLSEARDRSVADELGAQVAALWASFAEAEPGVDFTRIYPFVTEG
jgi:3-hydroxyisobutyrate dehydrogenase